jgi:uroporphyrinogen III methyltransferase / synthase
MSKVYLVGAGPGDPELITIKGRRVLQQADCVLYDHLANPALLDFAPEGAERLYVGKKKAEHPYSQDEICALLVERARRGRNVVRLKGGDPFLFGRGGEELDALVEAGIEFEVVPGVTSPAGIAAYSGVPLTHREHTSAVTFVTGHSVSEIDWSKIGAAETVVLLMGLTTFAEISARLIENGRSPATPAMAVRWGTRPDQETITGTLGDLAHRVEASGMKPPATIFIGEVVALRDRFNWYERLPLFGQRIVITRDRSQAGELAARLHALGADVAELPTIEIQPPADPAPLDRAIGELDAYDWLIFTSANGVRYFLDRLDGSARDWRGMRARICAIGPATRKKIEAAHLKVDLMPEQYVAESLVEAFACVELAGKRVLLPRAAVARDLVPAALRERGAAVDVVEAYRTGIPTNAGTAARRIWSSAHRPDWIAFTSSSTVNNFVAIAGLEPLRGVRIASIGPATSATVRKHGLEVDAEARPYTMDGLVAALIETRRI